MDKVIYNSSVRDPVLAWQRFLYEQTNGRPDIVELDPYDLRPLNCLGDLPELTPEQSHHFIDIGPIEF